MSHNQPIDAVKTAIEKVLPAAYLTGIVLVYIASAAVMSFLLYQPLLQVIQNTAGATIAAVLLCVSLQFMRFLIVFTDSLTAGANNSAFVIRLTSFVMVVLSILEVFQAAKAVQAATAIALSASALMFAGCVLELLFVSKLNKRDTETEAGSKIVARPLGNANALQAQIGNGQH